MKLSKDDLKEIVKECLVEILSEGLASSKSIVENRSARSTRQVSQHQATPGLTGRAAAPAAQQQRTSMYDKMSFIPQKDQVQRAATQKKINPLSMVKDITSDPVLAGVLAETASSGQHLSMNESNTSNSQPSHEEQVMSSGDAAARKMLMSDPTELFGDSVGMWSTLAFSSPGRK